MPSIQVASENLFWQVPDAWLCAHIIKHFSLSDPRAIYPEAETNVK